MVTPLLVLACPQQHRKITGDLIQRNRKANENVLDILLSYYLYMVDTGRIIAQSRPHASCGEAILSLRLSEEVGFTTCSKSAKPPYFIKQQIKIGFGVELFQISLEMPPTDMIILC